MRQLFCFLGLAVLAPSLPAQGQVYFVDGSGNTPSAFLRITDAAAVAAAGDVIVIKGMRDASGITVGYSETTYSPNVNPPETFPISPA